MEFVFNEHSLNFKAKDFTEAAKCFFSAFENLIEVQKRRSALVYLLASSSFDQILLGDHYSFSHWLSTITDIEFARFIRSVISKKPFIKCAGIYSHGGLEVVGLGYAYERQVIVVSFPPDNWEEEIKFFSHVQSVKDDSIKIPITVKNISKIIHCDQHIPERFFDHHKKHDNRRLNLKDGESTLYYSIPSEQQRVQKLLNGAIGDNLGGKLFNYDSAKRLYIEFQSHIPNRYHGYHIEDSNRVPGRLRRILQS